MPVRLVAVQDTELEVSEWGLGEPVVFIQTALTADELLPLANEPALDRATARSSAAGAGTPAAAQSTAQVRSRATPPTAMPCWPRWGSSAHTSSGSPTAERSDCDSGPWFAEVRDLVRGWLPHAEDVVIDGADHSLALTHASRVAQALVAFLRRNAIEAARRVDLPGHRRTDRRPG